MSVLQTHVCPSCGVEYSLKDAAPPKPEPLFQRVMEGAEIFVERLSTQEFSDDRRSYTLKLTSVHGLSATPYAALVAMARAVVHYEDSKTAAFSYWRKCGGCGVVSKLDLREPTPWHCPTGCPADTGTWLSGDLLREEPK